MIRRRATARGYSKHSTGSTSMVVYDPVAKVIFRHVYTQDFWLTTHANMHHTTTETVTMI